MLILGSGLMRKRGSIESQLMYATGTNGAWQLGNGDQIARSSPVVVSTLGAKPKTKSWTTISTGVGSVLALNSAGEMYVWGQNLYYVWGNNSTDDPNDAPSASNRSSPTLVSSNSWTMVGTGGYTGFNTDELSTGSTGITSRLHVTGIQSDGTLWTWGSNGSGQLGQFDARARSSPAQVGTSSWTSVAAGALHSIGISGGNIYTWGSGVDGKLGTNDIATRSSPTLVSIAFTPARVYAAGLKSFATDASGALYWAGSSLAYPGGGNRSNFTVISTINSIADFCPGPVHAIAIKSNGTMWTAGDNTYGQIGSNNTTTRSNFAQVGSGTNWSKGSTSIHHTLALTGSGDLYGWGRNDLGQLGLNDAVNRSSPTLISSGVADMLASTYNTYYLKTDGTLWSTGNNLDGSLGDVYYLEQGVDRPSITRSSPIQIGTGFDTTKFTFDRNVSNGLGKFLYEDKLYMWGVNGSTTVEELWLIEAPAKYRKFPYSWTAASMGVQHAAAIRSDGTLWTWGTGNGGALGINNTLNRSSPTQVGTDTDWVSVSCGSSFTVALKSTEGSGHVLYVWGLGTSGQLGASSSASRSSPVTVPSTGGIGWSKVAAGGNFVWAIDSSGDLYTWGGNVNGQLGLSSTVNKSSPTLARAGIGTDTILAPSNFLNYGHFIDSNKKLWSVGINTYGNLGISSLTTMSSFVQVGTSSWSAVAAGYWTSAGVTSNGRYFAWGRNLIGQIGGLDPAIDIYKNSPVQVGSRSSWTIVGTGGISATSGNIWAVSNEAT